jgi:hypothetical protein
VFCPTEPVLVWIPFHALTRPPLVDAVLFALHARSTHALRLNLLDADKLVTVSVASVKGRPCVLGVGGLNNLVIHPGRYTFRECAYPVAFVVFPSN